MPSSDPQNIPDIIRIAQRCKPNSILDIGVGFGKYGLLFREYLDGHRQGSIISDKSTWKLQLDGVEVFEGYLSPVHWYLYSEIYTGDIRDLVKNNQIGSYEFIFMGDVLEHFPLNEGRELVENLYDRHLKPGGRMVISTPNFESNWNKKMPFGNEFERHLCRWTEDDFNSMGKSVTIKLGKLLTVEILKG